MDQVDDAAPDRGARRPGGARVALMVVIGGVVALAAMLAVGRAFADRLEQEPASTVIATTSTTSTTTTLETTTTDASSEVVLVPPTSIDNTTVPTG